LAQAFGAQCSVDCIPHPVLSEWLPMLMQNGCPICCKRPSSPQCGMRVFAQGYCPVCADDVDSSVIALPCGHLLCDDHFKTLGGELFSQKGMRLVQEVMRIVYWIAFLAKLLIRCFQSILQYLLRLTPDTDGDCPSSSGPTSAGRCIRMISGDTIEEDVQVSSGQRLILEAAVLNGNLSIRHGKVKIRGGIVNGDIVARRGASVTCEDCWINGDVRLDESSSFTNHGGTVTGTTLRMFRTNVGSK